MPYGVVANYGVRPNLGVVANAGVQPNYGTGGAGGAQLTPVFQSDWATQLGTSLTARLDGTKWTQRVDGGIAVIDAAGLGFPSTMAKVIDIPWNTGGLMHVDTMAVPSAGDVRYYRWYYRLDVPDAVAVAETHPIQDGFSAADSNWMFKAFHNEGGAGNWRVQVEFLGMAYPNQRWRAINVNLTKGEVYRVEFRLEVVTSTTYKAQWRLYDEAGTLVVDNGDLFQEDSTTVTLESADPTFTFRNLTDLHGLNCGTNNTGVEGGRYGYQGGFAVCDNQGWIGAYGNVTGEAQ